MTATTFTKVTSLESSCGDPTPPHPTPKTEAADDVQSIPDTDLLAVSQTLVPIQEDLNDSADEALYPSPPVQTPEPFSPAPSVIVRQLQRTRGLSTINDRLAQLSYNEHFRAVTDKDNCSLSPSLDSEGEGSGIDLNFPPLSTTGSIPIALGSPRINPLITNYLAYHPTGLDSTTNGMGDSKNGQGGRHHGGQGSRFDVHHDGVTEKSIWAEEVMGDLERALMRLEQLAEDEGVVNDGKTASAHYLERLQKALNGNDRKYPVAVKDK